MFKSLLSEKEFLNVCELIFDLLKEEKDALCLLDLGKKLRKSHVPLFTGKISDLDILFALSLLIDSGCIRVRGESHSTTYYSAEKGNYFPFEEELQEAFK